MTERLRIAVEGVVQGVGFRPFVYTLASSLGVRGFVANRAGDVVIEAEGARGTLHAFVAALRERAPAAARVDRVTTAPAAPRGEPEFHIEPSDVDDASAAAIAPDIATCDACIAEVIDRTSRRHRYAFTSCAACGPRLTIVTAAPYDRARTTMAAFPMCEACRAENDDLADRRFHAQPIACPACGPRLELLGDTGDALALTADAIRRGEIVAIKGLGGYHLACDARDEQVVAKLRARKQRDGKPFAVMVADVARAGELAELGDAEAALLASPARPIVLVPARARVIGTSLAPSVAPGVADLGVMLPYTPLHHLLLRELDGMPLVMTSGNVSDEPIAFRDDDARARLGDIADRFLVHDRDIHMRCEDSVARVVGGAPLLLRRARGYAPAPIRVRTPIDRPTLALGGELKSAFALGTGDTVFVSPHMGDLGELSAYEAFVTALYHFQALHRVAPERVVCDRHPDYATTRLASELARTHGWELVTVQHHHAHFASALADAAISGPAIGVIFDGAGYGDDGAIWGGEILVGDAGNVRRAFHLAYVPQPGGDAAAREPNRMAVAHLYAAGASVAMFGPDGARLAALCALPRLAPRTSSVGRLFDAVAAITGVALARRDSLPPSSAVEGRRGSIGVSYEGEAAMRLEALARGTRDAEPYPFEVRPEIGELVVAPMIRAIARDADARVPAEHIASRFHATIVELAATACEQLARDTGITDVMLSGGVFQNAILAERLPLRLAAAGLRAHVHRRVPPNDGGLALGQLAVATARGGRPCA